MGRSPKNYQPHGLVTCAIEEMTQKYPARITSWGGNRSIDPDWMTDGTIMLSSDAIADEKKRYTYENTPPRNKTYSRDVSSERLQAMMDQHPPSGYCEAQFVGYRDLKHADVPDEKTAFYAFNPYDDRLLHWKTGEMDWERVCWAVFDPRLISLVGSLLDHPLEKFYVHRTHRWHHREPHPALVYKMPSLFQLEMAPDAYIMPVWIHRSKMTKGRWNSVNENSYTIEKEKV